MVVRSYNIGSGTYNCTVSGAEEGARLMTAAHVDSFACRIGTRLAVLLQGLPTAADVLDKDGEYLHTDRVTCKLSIPDEEDITAAESDTVSVTVQMAYHQSEMGRFMRWCGISPKSASKTRTFQVSIHSLRSVPLETDEDTFLHVAN